MFSDKDINNFKLAQEKISSAQRILLVSHLSPDVDAIASLCFFIELLKDTNKYFLALADNKKDDYYFLPNEEKIISSKDILYNIVKEDLNKGQEVSSDILKFFDLVIVVDCGSLERTSLSEEIKNIRNLMLDTFVIEFDHHAPVKTYADLEIKFSLASTTEVLYYLADINKIKINRNLANCILAGILTDTANFLYPSVTSKTLEIASEMMALGAQFPKLLNSTWRNKSFLEMKIWGLALANLKVNKKYNIASSVLPYEDLNNFKNLYGDFSADVFSDIVGFLSNLSEADITMLIREEEKGKIKGSLRVGSLNPDVTEESGEIKDIDVTKLAKIFGGGGHKKASGFLLEGSIVKENNGFRVV